MPEKNIFLKLKSWGNLCMTHLKNKIMDGNEIILYNKNNISTYGNNICVFQYVFSSVNMCINYLCVWKTGTYKI